MAETVLENAAIVLRALYEDAKRPGTHGADGRHLAEITGLEPAQINDAVTILQESGQVEWQRFLGTTPFEFGWVVLTPRGKLEYERLLAQAAPQANDRVVPVQPAPIPVGSPYGFQDADWEILYERRTERSKLFVVLGCQYESAYYDRAALAVNIENDFVEAVAAYNARPTSPHVDLDFRTLTAGYGEHLFNEICRDIISADIAVFETSDHNPNVMLEMGVALTWGLRVLPIKLEGRLAPPSDISGQTYADYQDNGARFVDPNHDQKMLSLVERAARKKRA